MIFRKQALIHDFQKRLIKYLLYQSMTERAFHDVVKANSDTQSAKKKDYFNFWNPHPIIFETLHYPQLSLHTNQINLHIHMYTIKTPKSTYIHTHTRSERLICTYVCMKLRSYADRLINI